MNSVKELLKVAEWMHPNNKIGERCHPSHGHGVFIDNIGEYNPLTNDTQCLELLERLGEQGWEYYCYQEDGKFIHVLHCGSDKYAKSKSLPEAVLAAAIEEV